MPASWGEIFPELMRAKLIATRGVKERLMALDDPLGVIATGKNIGLEGGQLTDEVLDRLIAAYSPTPKPTMRDTIGRTIAPINDPEPFTIQFRNNLPDWRKEDFPMDATDCDVDLLVHYDITGNSITEGKMSDINAAFSNRLERLRKLIIKNSSLPFEPFSNFFIHKSGVKVVL